MTVFNTRYSIYANLFSFPLQLISMINPHFQRSTYLYLFICAPTNKQTFNVWMVFACDASFAFLGKVLLVRCSFHSALSLSLCQSGSEMEKAQKHWKTPTTTTTETTNDEIVQAITMMTITRATTTTTRLDKVTKTTTHNSINELTIMLKRLLKYLNHLFSSNCLAIYPYIDKTLI